MELREKLLSEAKRPTVVKDCVTLIDTEVANKGGLSGLAIKGAYKLVKNVKPGFVAGVVNFLLDEWVDKLSPFYDSWKQAGAGKPLDRYLGDQSDAVAEKLLEVTDKRARENSGPVVSAYNKLRPTAKKHVADAVPGLGAVVQRHV